MSIFTNDHQPDRWSSPPNKHANEHTKNKTFTSSGGVHEGFIPIAFAFSGVPIASRGRCSRSPAALLFLAPRQAPYMYIVTTVELRNGFARPCVIRSWRNFARPRGNLAELRNPSPA